jgi:hypothetical protein
MAAYLIVEHTIAGAVKFEEYVGPMIARSSQVRSLLCFETSFILISSVAQRFLTRSTTLT